MSICEGISKNNYVCKDGDDKYTVNVFQNINPANIKINEARTEIALTPTTNNHYFLADETAHCSEKWQHWFCIPYYHHRNGIDKNPDTDMMSVGKCYTYCKEGYAPSLNKIDKCSIVGEGGSGSSELLFNPLAIIAMFGTNMYHKTTDPVIPSYTNIRDTIGIRGSYLNDLYRVNNSDRFITLEEQKRVLGGDKIVNVASYERQQKIILSIIRRFVTKGLDGDGMGMSREIIHIKEDIKKSVDFFIQKYVKDIKYTKNKQVKLLQKIKEYRFDTGILAGVFGKDANNKDRLKNAITYANLIMNLVCKDGSANTDKHIRQLFKFNNIFLSGNDEANLIKIVKTAFYNCFTVNYDIFETYLKTIIGTDGDTVFYNDKEADKEYKYSDGATATATPFLYKCEIAESDLEIVSTESKYNIPYYNNITFYDHQILSEYSDNEKSFIYILTIFGIFLGFVAGGCLLYAIAIYAKYPKGILLVNMINYVNYCSLFYSLVTVTIIHFFSYLYYYLLCRYSASNYTIISLFFKIINIIIIVSLVSYVINTVLNLLNINYCMLSNENGGGDCDNTQYVYWYMVQLYLIAIYAYSMYLMRYGRLDIEYDILVNPDATPEYSKQYIHLLLLEKYLTNIKAMFDVYSGTELSAAKSANDVLKAKKQKEAAEADAVEADAVEAAEGVMSPGLSAAIPNGIPDITDISNITALASNPFALAQGALGDPLAQAQALSQGFSDPVTLFKGKASQAFGNQVNPFKANGMAKGALGKFL
jgi:hypothetical protein